MIGLKRQPVLSIPHGGGPCFFLEDRSQVWTGMAAFLRSIQQRLPSVPKAILMVCGHWETTGFVLTGAERPGLIYDYGGFPAHTYSIRYDAPGAPELAQAASHLLQAAHLPSTVDSERGWDHGVFIPLKVAYPDATIPVVELSLDHRMDPSQHIAAGQALATLRDQGVLIIGSGMSFHNLSAFGNPGAKAASEQFDSWLTAVAEMSGEVRAQYLRNWSSAPSARLCHPREEHLMPLLVAAGAATGRGERIYSEHIMNVAVSGYRFD